VRPCAWCRSRPTWTLNTHALAHTHVHTHTTHRDEETLKRAAVRLVQKQASLDLGPCKQWVRFCDIHYQRPSKVSDKPDAHDVVTVFCVMVDDLPPQPKHVEVKEVRLQRM